MKYTFTTLLLLSCLCSISAQNEKTQTIRGKVVDNVSEMTLIGVAVIVDGTNLNGVTDIDGNFVIENVPAGRHIITTQYLGYEPYISSDLIVSTSKEIYLEIKLKEQVEVTETVVISASKGADGVGNQALNDLSVVSTRSFSVEETKRYAASIDDPGRMAAATPGVRTDQDNENDVIIRGNTAFGVLWRLEGLELTNPSHFARPGTTAGGVTVFSAALLGTTDLSTGGFAAEYGNAFSGVFDMRFRAGNMIKREHSVKIGLVGIGFATEGPMKKGRSSYLINYRYSTLGILNAMGLYVVRDNVSNAFQDLSFAFTFNSKDNKNQFKIFGVGGQCDELWSVKDTAEWITNWDYQYEKAGSNLGVLGLSFRRLLTDKSYIKATVGTVFSHIFSTQFQPEITNLENRDSFEVYDYKILRTQINVQYSHKFSNQFRVKSGALFHAITHWLSLKERLETVTTPAQQYLDYADNGTDFLLQGYIQGSYRPNNKFTVNIGMHAMYFATNNTYSIEPRLSVQYKPSPKTTLSAAYGIHGKLLAMGTYYLRIKDKNGKTSLPNKYLKIPKMHHAILSFQQVIGLGFRAQVELYYQYSFDSPVGADSSSTFWLFNDRTGFGYENMLSQGQGQNFGIDMTIEKAFGRNFFVLVTGSIYAAQYKSLGDTEWRRTRTDKRWGTTIMGGYEFVFKKGGVLQIGIKSFISGGMRYTPADEAASKAAGVLVPDEDNVYGATSGTYFRLDARLAYRKDHKKLSYTISIDVQNCTNMQNVYSFGYNRQTSSLVPRYQSGLLPLLNFQLDF